MLRLVSGGDSRHKGCARHVKDHCVSETHSALSLGDCAYPAGLLALDVVSVSESLRRGP